MKTKQIMILTLLLGVLLGREAQAFYNPSAGRWLSRDPIEERVGPNLNAMAKNNAINKVDALGLLTDESMNFMAEWQCMPCKCKSVTVTYDPGGHTVQLGPYKNWWDHYTYGSKVHVSWTVEGRPRKCQYFQDEKGTFGIVTLNGQNVDSIAGVDGHVASQEYTDKMGFNFGTYPSGTYTMTVVWNVTFRCVSSDGSGVTRHDSSTVTAYVTVPFW